MAWDYSTGRHYADTAVVSAFPCTMSCWLYLTTTGTAGTPLNIGSTTTSGGCFGIEVSTAGAAVARIVGTTSTANTGGTISTNQWSHVCITFISDTSRAIYVNGSKTSFTTTGTLTANLNRTSTGARFNGSTTFSSSYNEYIAEAAIWNETLSDEDILALADGVSPRLIRPVALRFYVPMIREAQELRGNTLTAAGTAVSIVEHPRRIG